MARTAAIYSCPEHGRSVRITNEAGQEHDEPASDWEEVHDLIRGRHYFRHRRTSEECAQTPATTAPPKQLRIVVRIEGGNVTGIMADDDLPGIELHAFVYDVDNEEAGDDMTEERELFESLPQTLY